MGQGTLAIDLGSSSTLVAWQGDASSAPELLALPPLCRPSGPPLIPSLVQFGPGKPLLGQQVLDSGNPEGWVGHFKPLLNQPTPPPEAQRAAEALLQGIWERLPSDRRPQRLVLTAPVEGFAAYRRWLHHWASDLAVPELALVDEPTAAALGAGLAPGSLVLVLDMGAGTTDLSLVRLEGGEGKAAPMAQLLRFAGRNLAPERQGLRTARVLAKAGQASGGRQIDRDWALALGAPHPQHPAWLAAAEQLKCALSGASTAQVLLEGDGPPRLLRAERQQLEAVLNNNGLAAQLDGLLAQVAAAARRAGTELDQLDGVLAVGGGSHLPWLQQWLAQRLPHRPLPVAQPLEAVVRGALAMTPALQVLDVLSQAVSLRCWDRRLQAHRWHPLFLAGQAWPTPQPLELVLSCSRGQTALELQLGTPEPECRAEVVFRHGLPSLRPQAAGSGRVSPWGGSPQQLVIEPPAEAESDRLRLQFHIDGKQQLWVQGQDLVSNQALGPHLLGMLE